MCARRQSDGNPHLAAYYDSNEFNADYNNVFGQGVQTLYRVADTWENYDRIAPEIDRRFKEWKEKRG